MDDPDRYPLIDWEPERAAIEALLAEGWSPVRIARRYGVGNRTIYRRLIRWGIDHRDRPGANRATDVIDPAWLRARYLEDGQSIADIARQTDRAPGTIHWLLKRHGIPRRGKGRPRKTDG